MTAEIFLARTIEFFSFEYSFALMALIVAMSVGLVCAVLGVFLVLDGLSLVGDATGHAALPGVCLGFLLAGGLSTVAMLTGALITCVLAAALVGYLSEHRRTRTDAAIGVVLSSFFGVGIVLLSYLQSHESGTQAGLNAFLYGNAAGVSPGQTALLFALSMGVTAICWLGSRAITLVVFDPTFARSTGIPVFRVRQGLLLMLALATVVSIQATGVVLVAAMLIIPSSAAILASDRMHRILLLAAILGLASGFGGAFISFVFEGVSTGPAMVVVATSLFVVALMVGPRGGVIPRYWRARGRR